MSDTLTLARRTAELLKENKAQDVVILNVADNFGLTDYFVIATGQSRPHLGFLSKELKQFLSEECDDSLPAAEGEAEQGWILKDCRDVVVHLFTEETRQYYDLEGLWGDAEVIPA